MGWYYPEMGGYGGDGLWFVTFLYAVVVFVDLVLIGMYLWKQIHKRP